MALVGLLRTEGPLAATRAAELLGESSGTCSFHLRQLAKYGLVEEAGGGTGREKPWRATTTSTGWDATGDGTPEGAAASGLLSSVIAGQYFEQLARWLEASPDEPQEWRQAAVLGDRILYVTPAELEELGHRLSEVLDEYFERQVRPGEPAADEAGGSVLVGARFITRSALARASLISAATINFFNLMFALALLYAVRELHLRAGLVGLLLGVAAFGSQLGAMVTKRTAARIGAGWTYTAGRRSGCGPRCGWRRWAA